MEGSGIGDTTFLLISRIARLSMKTPPLTPHGIRRVTRLLVSTLSQTLSSGSITSCRYFPESDSAEEKAHVTALEADQASARLSRTLSAGVPSVAAVGETWHAAVNAPALVPR